jgi:5-methyltetrahydropteroyltriglutamate--homocysteine methyltransferase
MMYDVLVRLIGRHTIADDASRAPVVDVPTKSGRSPGARARLNKAAAGYAAAMKRSTEHIVTTHTGSLPRPVELAEALERRDSGEGADADLDARIRDAVIDVVRRQAQVGIEVVNDGEAGKIGYSTYVKERLDGFGGEGAPHRPPPDAQDFPEYFESRTDAGAATPACIGPLSYRDTDAVRADIANLKAGVEAAGASDAFMTAASPGVIALPRPGGRPTQ